MKKGGILEDVVPLEKLSSYCVLLRSGTRNALACMSTEVWSIENASSRIVGRSGAGAVAAFAAQD